MRKKGRLEKPTGTVRGTPGSPPQDPRSFFLSRFSLSSISSALPPLFLFQHLIHSQPLLHPPSLVADGCPSTRVSRIPLPREHLAIRERIHTCPGQLLCQHQIVSGMCEVSPHLRLPLQVFKTGQRSGEMSGLQERAKGARVSTHHGLALRLSAARVTPVR